MRYLITDNNIKWDTTYKNAMYFNTLAERNNFVANNVHRDWLIALETAPQTYSEQLSPNGGTIEIEWTGTYRELFDKNTIILQEDINVTPTFYFITDIRSLDNNHMFELDVESNLFLNFTGIFDGVSNLRLLQGHVPMNYYTNKSWDVGEYAIINKTRVARTNNNIENTPFIYVFEKTSTNASHLEYIYDTEANKLRMPYSVKIAPVIPIDLNLATNKRILVEGSYDIDELGSKAFVIGGMEEAEVINFGVKSESVWGKTIGWGSSWYEDEAKDYGGITMSDVWNKWQMYAVNAEKNHFTKYSGGKLTIANLHDGKQGSYESQANRSGSLYNIMYDEDTNTLTVKTVTRSEIIPSEIVINVEDVGASSTYDVSWASYSNENINDFVAEASKKAVGNNTPLVNFEIWDAYAFGGVKQYWNSNALIDYIEDSENNANIINIKVSNYNPVKLNSTYDVVSGYESIENISFSTDDGDSVGTLEHIDLNYSQRFNTYRFSMMDNDSNNDFEIFSGLQVKKLLIENQKVFDLDIQYVDRSTGEMEFEHLTLPSPNEWEERIKWNTGAGVNTFTSNTVWSNEKEGFSPTNDYATYKANNPVQSKFDFIKPFGAFANPLTYLAGPGGIGAAALSAVSGEVGTHLSHQNMKKSPEDIKGSGNIYPDLIFNDFESSFILENVSYRGTDYEETVLNLFQFGLQMDNGLIVSDFETIRRPKFNYLKIANFSEASNGKYNTIITDRFNTAFQNGVRIWHSYDTFNTYVIDNDYIDNGDKF